MLRSPSLPELVVKKDDWSTIIDSVRSQEGMEKTSDVDCLALYSVCPLSIADAFTFHALQVYIAVGGLSRAQSPAEYYELPALYVAVCNIIDDVKRKLKPKP